MMNLPFAFHRISYMSTTQSNDNRDLALEDATKWLQEHGYPHYRALVEAREGSGGTLKEDMLWHTGVEVIEHE